jgi:phosphate transport system substrate-binding protein
MKFLLPLLGAALSLHGAALAADIKGAGATFPSAVYKTWAAGYEKERGGKVSYQPTGSGDGIKRIVAREVDFGASDSPMNQADLDKNKLLQFPTAVGGIVPVVNLRGVNANQLRLTGEVLADIMRGAITQWNDKRITVINPELSLPAAPIVRVVRAEKSGTTEAFTKYLSLMSFDWKDTVGHGQLVKWSGQVTAVEGNDGIVKAMKETQGAIGYASYDRVISAKLVGVRLRNRAGQFVAASEEGFRFAVKESDLDKKGDETASLLDQPGPLTWPISITTYVLIDAQPKTAASAREAMQFLYWAFLRGDPMIRNSGLTPLPTAIQAKLVPRFQKVRPQDGQPLNFYGF